MLIVFVAWAAIWGFPYNYDWAKDVVDERFLNPTFLALYALNAPAFIVLLVWSSLVPAEGPVGVQLWLMYAIAFAVNVGTYALLGAGICKLKRMMQSRRERSQ